MSAARAFGLSFRPDTTTIKALKSYGIDLEEASGETHNLLPTPAAYVLDTEGIARFRYVNPDYKVRVDPKALLAAARKAASGSLTAGKQ